MITVVTAHTPNYAHYVPELTASLDRYNIPYLVLEYRHAGDWMRNVSYKPTAIQYGLRELGTDIVWIDVDATLSREPTEWQNLSGDVCLWYNPSEVAEHWFDFKAGCTAPNTGRVRTPAGGAMYFRNCPDTARLVATWRDLSDAYCGITNDEQTLRRSLELCPVVVGELPDLFDWLSGLNAGYSHGGKPPLGLTWPDK